MISYITLTTSLDYNPITGRFTWKINTNKIKHGTEITSKDTNGYLRVGLNRKRYSLHKLAWMYIYGTYPLSQIDHINMIKSDNRICNLRLATKSENGMNRHKSTKNKSGYKGVSFHKKDKKFRARIKINGETKFLGNFNTDIEAYNAYCVEGKKLHKTFFNPN